MFLAFLRRRSHEKVPLEECHLLTPGLDALREAAGPLLRAARLGAREVTLEWSEDQAKASAHRTQCINNDKQLMLAFHLYGQDSDDVTPFNNWGFDTKVPGWLTVPPFNPNEANTNQQKGVYWKYIGNNAVYRCPDDHTNTPAFKFRSNKLSSYIVNGALCNYKDPVNGVYRKFKISQFPTKIKKTLEKRFLKKVFENTPRIPESKSLEPKSYKK